MIELLGHPLSPERLVLACALLSGAMMLAFGWLSRWQYLSLPELRTVREATAEGHVVIIPARNEEAVIDRAIRSFPRSPVVVVDDESADATASVARRAGAAVIAAGPLPPGWTGKPHACWTGAARTDSKWILFADADTWYEPEFLPSLLEQAAESGLAAASVFPAQVYGSLAERVFLPYAFGLYFTGVNARAVNDPQRREALANGQCFLFRRDAYRFLGGHRAVASSVIEDADLARALKRHRMNARVWRAERLARVRMYDSWAAIWRGFEKNSFRFLRANPRGGAVVVAASIVMTSWLPVLAALWWAGLKAEAALFALAPAAAWRPWYGSWLRSLAAPVAIYGFQLIALSALFKFAFGLTTAWKGRRV
jgi:cellulose synthase/poly-beta-1,6-N-acetylglucosamine synthase-like glycosyltransferase